MREVERCVERGVEIGVEIGCFSEITRRYVIGRF